uniref:histidine kinase n=1 Tax=Chromera velia CCMP2878 TaxID=1169474 RepID=A0A0G4I9F8_9ALVE|eukprot:Cvel_12256.t1-p1 / transcript=Cvel_12256.t1 / gene=Cvel_12256 / organism=Chromera_velia_CCMP2878 / gene_product=hypothetical protein / transcript_product=hypothetical protein / location=Cvel_scaffold793:52771-57569(-) / protein_length=855 / sequence_SO=supercontig / SO=protein_coding / is_pseudo=false
MNHGARARPENSNPLSAEEQLRQRVMTQQIAVLRPVAMTGVVGVSALLCLLYVSGVFDLRGLTMRMGYAGLMFFAVCPLGRDAERRELCSFVTSLLMSSWIYFCVHITRHQVDRDIDIMRCMIISVLNKNIIGVIHHTDLNFWVLNIVDGALWVLVCPPIPSAPKLAVAWAIVIRLLAASQRKMTRQTLFKVFEETQKRERAEGAKARFVSYIMHEMRNPLSGAGFLLVEFRAILTDLLKKAAEEGGGGPVQSALSSAVVSEGAELLRFTDMIQKQFDKMRSVCEDVLQLEKLDKGGFQLDFKRVDLAAWFDRIGRQESVATAGAGTEVRFKWKWTLDPRLQGQLGGGAKSAVGFADFLRLEQVIANFLSNARKFTKKGHIHLTACLRAPTREEMERVMKTLCQVEAPGEGTGRRNRTNSAADVMATLFGKSGEESEGGKSLGLRRQWAKAVRDLKKGGSGSESSLVVRAGTSEVPPESQCISSTPPSLSFAVLRVAVSDSGPGLSQEDMSKLFRPYSQVRAGELQNGGGTGLGLCICKSFVEAHGGGEIGVESEGRGKGSSFFFQLITPLVAVPPSQSSADLRESGREARGERKSTASTQLQSEGKSNLPRVEQKEEVDDCGKEEKENLTEEQTSVAAEDEGEAKPNLLSLPTPSRTCHPPNTSTAASSSSPSSTASPSSTNPPTHQYNADVLVVDDDQFCLIAAEVAIRRLGYSVEKATDGQEAVQMILNQGRSYRLILMDNNMGVMGGAEATRKILGFYEESRSGQGGKSSVAVSLPQRDRQRSKTAPVGGQLSSSASQTDTDTPRPPLILGCTGDVNESVRTEFEQAGATTVIHKPVDTKVLVSLLQKLAV